MKFKWIFIILIFYTITYFNFGYFDTFERNSYLYTSIQADSIIKYNFGYLYREENKTIYPKEISLKKLNLLGVSTILYKESSPPLTDKNNINFFLIPLWTKKIIINSIIEVDNQEIYIEQIHTPYFEFGIYSFWHWLIPTTWEFTRKIPLLKID